MGPPDTALHGPRVLAGHRTLKVPRHTTSHGPSHGPGYATARAHSVPHVPHAAGGHSPSTQRRTRHPTNRGPGSGKEGSDHDRPTPSAQTCSTCEDMRGAGHVECCATVALQPLPAAANANGLQPPWPTHSPRLSLPSPCTTVLSRSSVFYLVGTMSTRSTYLCVSSTYWQDCEPGPPCQGRGTRRRPSRGHAHRSAAARGASLKHWADTRASGLEI